MITHTELKKLASEFGGRLYSMETYGRETYAYVDFATPENRRTAEKALTLLKIKVDAEYWPGSSSSAVRVSTSAARKIKGFNRETSYS